MRGGLIVREALLSGFWGLQCPIHCQGSSLPSLGFSFLLGFILGIGICCGLFFYFAHPSLFTSAFRSPSPVVAAAAERAVRRLSLAVERQNSGQAGSSSVDEWERLPPSPRGRQDEDRSIRLLRVTIKQLLICCLLFPIIFGLLASAFTEVATARFLVQIGRGSQVLGQSSFGWPRASLPLDLRPTVYIILRAPGLVSPTRVGSASDLYRITGRGGF